MALRMERQAQSAARIVDFLKSHPMVRYINYPGLETHPGAEVHKQQATSGGSLLSFSTGECVPHLPRSPQLSLYCLLHVRCFHDQIGTLDELIRGGGWGEQCGGEPGGGGGNAAVQDNRQLRLCHLPHLPALLHVARLHPLRPAGCSRPSKRPRAHLSGDRTR